MKNEVKHTAHSSYRCEYHIVFAPKYRRKVIYKTLRKDVGEIFRKLCNEMKVEIIEAETCVDHIHMLVSKPPYMSIAQFVGTLKSKSTVLSSIPVTPLMDALNASNVKCGTLICTCGLRVAAILFVLPYMRSMETIVWIYITSWIVTGLSFAVMFFYKQAKLNLGKEK